MGLLQEIREKLAAISSNHSWRIKELPDTAPGYVFRDSIWYGVAMPYYGKTVNESFTNARIQTRALVLQNQTLPVLAIECSEKNLRYQFATLCESFLNPGENNARRNAILCDPYCWWNEWRELLGNAIHDKTPYQVLGELLTFEYLNNQGLAPTWAGPTGKTQDIQTDNCNYEVKSSTERYTTSVTISSKFQLMTDGKPLKLIFARFEEEHGGDSLDKAIKRLVLNGYDEDELLEQVRKQGFEKGNITFTKGYRLLELRQYEIDERFPILSDTCFVGGHLPEAITHFTYTIDLAGIPYTNLYENR